MKNGTRSPVHFTDDELRAVHWDLAHLPWLGETFYEERQSVIRKLQERFRDETWHLNLTTR